MIRTRDLFFAVTGLIALSPLILIVFCACLVDSKSPIVTQTRVGRYSRPFTIIKFRTMHVGTNSLGTHLVPDSSVTSVGRILRKFKLDELPQLINVARGEMSLRKFGAFNELIGETPDAIFATSEELMP